MRKVMSLPLSGDDRRLVHIEVEVEDTVRAALKVDQSIESFQQALERAVPAIQTVRDTLVMIPGPSEVSMEFGIKFGAKAGVVFASADTEATFKVSMKWSGK